MNDIETIKTIVILVHRLIMFVFITYAIFGTWLDETHKFSNLNKMLYSSNKITWFALITLISLLLRYTMGIIYWTIT